MARTSQSCDSGVPGAVPLSEVLAAVAERIHYAEGRRTNFTVVAGALLAGGIAVLTFIIDKHLARIITYPAVAAAITSIMLGLMLLVVYARQTNRYPWTDATRTWKWFYRDALPNQAQFDPKWWTIFWFCSERERLKAAYAEQLPVYRARLEEIKDAAISFDQDVQQLYVLHINEKFKNVHLSQLRSLFQIGVWVIVAFVLLAVIVGAWADRQRLVEHRLNETYGDLRLQAAWRFISISEGDQTVLVQVAAQNLGQDPVTAPSWFFLDVNGFPVPAEVTAATHEVDRISANSTAHYTLFVRPAENMPVASLLARAE